jgi:hypothetical protein
MKRNINKDLMLTEKGSIPKEKSSFSIDVKGGEKNRGMERKRRDMKIGGARMSMSVNHFYVLCLNVSINAKGGYC